MPHVKKSRQRRLFCFSLSLSLLYKHQQFLSITFMRTVLSGLLKINWREVARESFLFYICKSAVWFKLPGLQDFMFAGRLQDVILSKLWRYGKPSASNATTFEWTRNTNYDGFLGSFSSFCFASLLFLQLWEKYLGALGMARSFIWFVSFM